MKRREWIDYQQQCQTFKWYISKYVVQQVIATSVRQRYFVKQKQKQKQNSKYKQ